MDRLANRVVSPKAEGHIAHATRDFCPRQVLLDPARGLNKIHGIVVVFVNACGNCEDVGVKNDVFWREVHLVYQQPVSTLADFDLALVGVGLAFFVKGHDHGGRAVALEQLGLAQEGLDAFFHGDGVHHCFTLHAAQSRLNDIPLGRVNHDRHPGNVGLTRDQI